MLSNSNAIKSDGRRSWFRITHELRTLIPLAISLPLLLGGCGVEEVVNLTELEVREGIAYSRGSDTPFTGKVFELHEDGQKYWEEDYKDGKSDGLYEMWYKNGQKGEETNFKDGNFDGLCTKWYKNGQKMSESFYEDSVLVSKKEWNEKGELIDGRGIPKNNP